ncbi:MAG: RNA polymerase sigma factor [Acidobacteriia bacterium]|nr:RNA polymerase sigma factor [Terriglobia bacterium]
MTIAMAMERVEAGRAEPLSREQFEVFYGRTARALRSYICRVAANPAIADDILQESYIRLLSAPPMLDGPRKSYLYRTATNLVTDYHRAQSRQRRWWQLTPRRAEAADSTVELSSDMERLFARVTEQERALLWLAYVEGEGHREIAEILGLKEKSVKVLLFRARRKMEEILKSHGFEASHE